MSFRGQLIKAGISSNGTDITIFGGTFILKGRMTTMTKAGGYVTVDATTWRYEEGIELRYSVTDWTDSSVLGYSIANKIGYLGAFTGLKIATQCATESAAGKTLQGIDSDCRVNDVTAGDVSSIKAHVYIKGSTAKTVNNVFGGESEVEVANSSGTLTVTTKMIAHEFRMRVSAAVADSTNRLKCHGVVIKAGDTDGQTVTVGTGLLIENYASGGGTVTWTTGLKITDCLTAVDLSGVAASAYSNIVLGGCGRISTSTSAGAALDIDASCTRSQGMYLRYSVSDWTGKSNFFAAYLRAETGASAAGKELNGIEVYATAGHACGQLRSIESYAYVKTGSTSVTIGPIYGISAELTFDAGTGTKTITTEAMPLRVRITGGKVDTYTKIHGIQLMAGDMNAASPTYGYAIEIKDGPETGTVTWTTGLRIQAPCVTGISIAAGSTATLGVSITGIMGGATSRGVKSEITINNCAFTDGYAANELNLTTTGTDAGYPAAAGSWVNVNSTCVAGYYVLARSDGIWENQADSGDVTDAKIIFGARVQAQLTNTPERVCPWSLNVSGCTITALYDISTFHSTIGYTANSTEGTTKVGAVAFMVDVAGNKQYIRLYSSVA